uniref:Uncharacterized protein n=1 Tax=Fundulus heteroclitus TaxID=8078 RepID=A0A3Q2NS76_FUNHE
MERKLGTGLIQRQLTLGLWILILMLGMFVFSIVIQEAGAADPIRRQERDIQDKDDCLTQHRVIELHYTLGTRVVFEFDLCSVANCGGDPSIWQESDVYACVSPKGIPEPLFRWCYYWVYVRWHTGNEAVPVCHGGFDKETITIIRGPHQVEQGAIPIILTISGLNIYSYLGAYTGVYSEYSSGVTKPKPCSISPSGFYLVLGAGSRDDGPVGLIKISLHNATTSGEQIRSPQRGRDLFSSEGLHVDYNKLTPDNIIKSTTGDMRRNLWVSWMAQTARQYTAESCVACAAARPILTTEPAPLFPFKDPTGYDCILGLTKGRSVGCEYYHDIFPPINNDTTPGPFTPGNHIKQYVCFNFTGRGIEVMSRVGVIPPEWCHSVFPVEDIATWARAGLYYYCGGKQLFVRIPFGSVGVCALVRLVAPLWLIIKRSSDFNLAPHSPTYIDSIGVPRGVPDRYKLADQVAAGFESIFVWITPNKNVDRINYIHYNLLRLAEQLAPTSLMAVQNRMALNMLLAGKGGVCAMFGDMGGTFIPNNTAPDGLVTKALEGLRTLSETMHKQSGIENPLDKWLTQALGKWKNLIISMMLSLSVFLAILVTCGCCCVPCLRTLAVRFIVTPIEKGTLSLSSPNTQMLQVGTEPLLKDVRLELVQYHGVI